MGLGMAARPLDLHVAPPATLSSSGSPRPRSLQPALSPACGLGTYHSWKLAAWVESQKLMPITAVVDSPGARDSECKESNEGTGKAMIVLEPSEAPGSLIRADEPSVDSWLSGPLETVTGFL